MDPTSIVNVVVLIIVAYVALRVGAVLMKVLLGLIAIALLIWLLAGLFGGAPVGASAGTASDAIVLSASVALARAPGAATDRSRTRSCVAASRPGRTFGYRMRTTLRVP